MFIETDLSSIITALRAENPDIAIVDSIQTIYNTEMESLPGNVSQVRSCGYDLTNIAKESGMPLFMIGHVNKDGNIAGPRVLEHLVDGLLLFEGDDQHAYRLLRSVKNRFGSSNEVGIFEMTGVEMIKIHKQISTFERIMKDPDRKKRFEKGYKGLLKNELYYESKEKNKL